MKYVMILAVLFSMAGCDIEECEEVEYTDDRYIFTETEYYTIAEPDKNTWVCK